MVEDFAALVEEKCAIKILTMEKLFSRRNEVYLVNALAASDQVVQYVLKICNYASAEQEALWLQELKASGIKVPKVKWSNSDFIVMEYIKGLLLADLMERPELIRQEQWLQSLAAWLYHLHVSHRRAGQVLCVPDLNLRNFIYTGQEIVGLDFEEAVWDVPERDLGGLAAFILNSDPMFSNDKYEAVYRLIKSYNDLHPIDREILREYFLLEMKRAAERRSGQRQFLLAKLEELQDIEFLV